MCGVVGTLTFGSEEFRVTTPYINKMRDVMAHRGPDGAGTWVSEDGRIGLGHRRLSIIDLSENAAQPMSSSDGRYWVSFNGEIYNHQEIREELIQLGHDKWKTDHSDTEVLVHAFREWGINCVNRFHGMFAFSIWDVEQKELWLVRDRIGVKPLYYSIHNNRIVFASEIKALLEDHEQKRAVNEEALYHYLSFLTTPAPMTLFEGINKLPGGCYMRIKETGDVFEHRYWDAFDGVASKEDLSDEQASDEVLSTLKEAVKLRKSSDVPIGIFLSGGVDSSANAALFSAGHQEKVKTFSVGYKGKYQSYKSELPFAREMAGFVNSEHHEIELGIDDLLDFLPRMVELQDEPIADAVCVPVYYLAKLARDNGVTVCQLGEGADELFCGYSTWEASIKRQHSLNSFVPKFVASLSITALELTGRNNSSYHEWARRHAKDQPQFWGGAEAFYENSKRELLSPRLRRKFEGFTSWEALKPIHERYLDKTFEKTPLSWMSYLDLNLRLPELLLMRVDKMCMGSGLEARVPFLDHNLVKLALSMPQTMRYQEGGLKRVLKKSVRGIIPDTIIDRPKQGFGVPIADWFHQELGNEMNSTLRSFCAETDFFDINAIEKLISLGQGTQLWFLYNFALWWNRFIK